MKLERNFNQIKKKKTTNWVPKIGKKTKSLMQIMEFMEIKFELIVASEECT